MLKHHYRNFENNLNLAARLIYDADKPTDVVSEFKKTEVSAEKPTEVNVDQKRDEALKSLMVLPKIKRVQNTPRRPRIYEIMPRY